MHGLFDSARRILTLSELAENIQSALRSSMPDALWIRAEIHKLNHYPQSGHCYPDLVEKADNKIKAQMRATIWSGDFQRINARFNAVARRSLGDNLVVLIWARVQHHAIYGLSLNILDIDPAYTLGILEREKLLCIENLKASGLFDLNRSRVLPHLPSRLAVISVESSKGYRDFIQILHSKGKRFAISHQLFPALLQGDKAVDSIAVALNQIEDNARNFDAVAIIRGGGGDIGLDCYNNYGLACRVAAFPLPVLTGIGHSTNETVIEMIANRNLITPTDLAYFILDQFESTEEELISLESAVSALVKTTLQNRAHRLRELSVLLREFTSEAIDKEHLQLDLLTSRIKREAPRNLRAEREKMLTALQALKFLPGMIEQRELGRLGLAGNTLRRQGYHLLTMWSQQLQNLQRNISNLDPARVLQRGYSITRKDGKAVKDSRSLAEGDSITTTFFIGSIGSIIKTKKE